MRSPSVKIPSVVWSNNAAAKKCSNCFNSSSSIPQWISLKLPIRFLFFKSNPTERRRWKRRWESHAPMTAEVTRSSSCRAFGWNSTNLFDRFAHWFRRTSSHRRRHRSPWQYPFLVDLVFCLESNLLTDFSIKFLSTWMFNLARTCKSSFRYPTSVKEFSSALYILAGPNAFEFVRLNIPGSIPSLTSVRSMLSSSEYQLAEGEFQYSRFQELIRPLDCKYAVCREDCTSVVPKVSYNKRTNSFVGFTLPLQDGFPRCQFYSTNSLEELESWHQAAQKSSLLNIHVLQGLTSQSQTPISPFLLAAYGTNGKYCAPDVLSRGSRSFDVMMAKGVRILGFSTDCDAKNLRAMRDAMAFFTSNDNPFLKHPHLFTISSLQVNKAKILIEERKININNHFFVFTLATDLRWRGRKARENHCSFVSAH